jgi:hypothetical protein
MSAPGSLDELVGQYRLAAAEYWNAQAHLGSRSALRRGNQAADDLRRIATQIGTLGVDAVRLFAELLDDQRNGVAGWTAFHLLEVMSAPPDVVDRAFRVLESIATGDGLTALGTRMRLRDLRTQFGRAPSTDESNL